MYLGLIAYFIYGGICIIGVIFCFSPEIFNVIDEKLNLQLTSRQLNNPLNMTMFSLDEWAKDHHRITGLILAFLSLIDLKMYVDVAELF